MDSAIGATPRGAARTGERLHVHAPLGRVQVERLERALLAQRLALVNELVAAIVPGTQTAADEASRDELACGVHV